MNSITRFVRELLEKTNLSDSIINVLHEAALILIIFVFSLIIYLFFKFIIIKFVKRIINRTSNKWDDMILDSKCIHRALYALPAIIFYSLVSYLNYSQKILELLLTIYIIFMMIYAFNGLFDVIAIIYDKSYSLSKKRPIKAFMTVLKIVLFIIGLVVIVSKMLGQTPLYILSGLGALSAITMLIFKDAILGFVAGFQMAANDLVNIGDWIEMPKYGADGDVIDISLTVVKVQNFDRTITTIPAYALVSDSFKNWRGMQNSGGRRIKRSINLDLSSIQFCSEELLKKLNKIHYLKEYIESRHKEIKDYNEEHKVDISIPVNGRRMTNIGVFRRYISEYLKNHPKVHKDMICMVRQLEPGNEGLPLEIYCFTNDTKWENYENIMSDIFDHLLAVVPYFELKVFQNPAGSDIRELKNS